MDETAVASIYGSTNDDEMVAKGEGCSCQGNAGSDDQSASDDSRFRPGQPHAGSATIVCDGSDGYRVDLGSWAGATCGTKDCVIVHENQHIVDWTGRWPDGCKGKANGAKIPLGGPGYAAFLKDSECKAHTADLGCAFNLAVDAAGDCKTTVKNYIDLTSKQKAKFC
jgi:hypothetical protein